MSFPFPKETKYKTGNLVTSTEIIDAFHNNNVSRHLREERNQKQKEEEFFKSIKIPNLYIQSLNLNVINNLLGADFYQFNVMEGIMFVSEELLIGKDLMQTSQKVHKNIGKLIELASGANGTVSTASIGDKSDLFQIIIKTAIDPKDDDLMHEAFVGLVGTNKLREEIPNFSFIYGAFKCDGPIMPGKGKEVKNFCTGKKGSIVTYALYENIKGKTVKDAISSIRADEFLNIYLQVLLAINYAGLKCDFTHFDLHSENVILRKLQKSVGVKYPTQTLGNLYIYTDVIPTIIDYGYSHIKYKNNDYGHFIVSSSDSFKSYPLHDAYKFLMFCAFWAYEFKNTYIIAICKEIHKFFNQEKLDNIISKERNVFYEMPNKKELRNLSIEPLVAFIIKHLKADIHTKPIEGRELLECKNMCLSLEQVEKEIGVAVKGVTNIKTQRIGGIGGSEEKINVDFKEYERWKKMLEESKQTERKDVIKALSLRKNFNSKDSENKNIEMKALSPKGLIVITDRCKQITAAGSRCTRRAVKDGYCTQHYNMLHK
jgi:hypothetical protein